MAINSFARSDANAVQLWASTLEVETNKALAIAPLMGDSEDSIIHVKKDLTKDTGDKITFNLRMQLSGDGKTEGQTLEGNEESYTIYSDSLVVNQLRHAVRIPAKGNISQQRVAFDMKKFARGSLRDWLAKRYSKVFFNHVCGYTPEQRAVFNGGNSILAATRIVRPAAAATDEAMTSDTYKFDLRLVDIAKEMAMVANPMIRPVSIDGRDCYVMYLDPRQVYDLKTNTSSGQWQDVQMAISMGFGKESPLVTGAIGMWNGVILREAPDNVLPLGVNSSAPTTTSVSNVRRGVLLGAQAACCAWSNGGGPTTYQWKEEEFDFGNEVGISAGTIYGMKKTQFNSADYGTVVISTYAPSHTTTT